jgi:hypothetical protein
MQHGVYQRYASQSLTSVVLPMCLPAWCYQRCDAMPHRLNLTNAAMQCLTNAAMQCNLAAGCESPLLPLPL